MTGPEIEAFRIVREATGLQWMELHERFYEDLLVGPIEEGLLRLQLQVRFCADVPEGAIRTWTVRDLADWIEARIAELSGEEKQAESAPAEWMELSRAELAERVS